MILNILPLIAKVRESNLKNLTPAKASAIGGLLQLLCIADDEARKLLYVVREQAVERFRSAGTPAEASEWLLTLLHVCHGDSENLFIDVIDDDEYRMLAAKQSEVEQCWMSEIAPLTDGTAHPFEDLPLLERLRRLLIFYMHDINALGGGDDEQAFTLLSSASRVFEKCREELFSSFRGDVESYILYYHVLSIMRPDHKCLDDVRHYRQYFHYFDDYFHGTGKDTELAWTEREIRFHHLLALEPHFDTTALAGLWLATPESLKAFRRQLYLWCLELDPYEGSDIQERSARLCFFGKGLSRLASWLHAKQSAGIAVPLVRQADVLRTIVLASLVDIIPSDLSVLLDESVWTVVKELQPSKQRTHLLALAADLYGERNLLAQAKAEIRAWQLPELSEEDKFLQEYLELLDS